MIGTIPTHEPRTNLLSRALARCRDELPTVLLTPAGFFGCAIDDEGEPSWPGIDEKRRLRARLEEIARRQPKGIAIEVGIDVGGSDERQRWFAGGVSFLKELLRKNARRDATELSLRKVTHAGYTLIGFVCGESYEWCETELVAELGEADVVVISAHTKVNRIWAPAVGLRVRRWAFHRRLPPRFRAHGSRACSCARRRHQMCAQLRQLVRS